MSDTYSAEDDIPFPSHGILSEEDAAMEDLSKTQAEIAELKKDKERLDWFCKNRSPVYIYGMFKYHGSTVASQLNWRDAIDQAIAAKEGTK